MNFSTVWKVFLVLCVLLRCAEEDAPSAEVTWNLFSGRPSPTFRIEEPETLEALRRTLASIEPADPIAEPPFGSFTVHLSRFGDDHPKLLVVFDPCAPDGASCPVVLASFADGRTAAFRDRGGLFRLLSDEAAERVSIEQ